MHSAMGADRICQLLAQGAVKQHARIKVIGKDEISLAQHTQIIVPATIGAPVPVTRP